MNTLVELHITTVNPALLPQVMRLLAAHGFTGSTVVQGQYKRTHTIDCYPPKNRAESLYKVLNAQLPAGAHLTLKNLLPADWETKWQRDFKPTALTARLRVVPAWLKKEARYTPAHDILLDTTAAFGTGLHPTTRLVAQGIEDHASQCRSLLDVGTGSGILSIVAKKCGIRTVHAFDNDPQSVITARQNARANKISLTKLETSDIAGYSPSRQFDIVAANVLAGPLVHNKARIASWVNPGGLLIVSGIWGADAPRFLRQFKVAGMKREKVCRKEKWVSVHYLKTEV